jgi:hypothetical protein
LHISFFRPEIAGTFLNILSWQVKLVRAMMMKNMLARTLSVLGSILIICSLLAILTIGFKAKNLLMVGSAAGVVAWVLAWMTGQNKLPSWLAIAFSLSASIVFAQRALANFWALMWIFQQQATNYDAKNKCTLIILLLLMTMASLTALMMSFVYQSADAKNQ